MEKKGVSLQERDRRWANIRREMAQRGLDGLIVVSDGHVERRGAMRYVADVGAAVMYHYVVFPLKGEPIGINLKGGWIKNIKPLPLRGGWVPESGPYAPVIADAIKELNMEKGNIGIEGEIEWDFIPSPVYQRLVKDLPKATLKPSTIIHELKRVKSPEELKFIEEWAENVDKACETCFKFAKPGTTENEISSEMCRQFYQMGMEDIHGFPLPRSTRILNPGDNVLLYPETQGPGGYWLHFGRMLAFKKPKKEVQDLWDFCLQAQKRGVEKLRPGNTGGDVMKAVNEALKGTPYIGSARGSGHGMGLDVLEKPFITFDDETVLKTNMTIGLHAILGSSTVPMYVQIADTYIITDGEPRILSKIPKEIKVL